MGDKTHYDFLPTLPGTQVCFVASKAWCAGHARLPWWLHNPLHRLHLLRRKSPRPLRYIND